MSFGVFPKRTLNVLYFRRCHFAAPVLQELTSYPGRPPRFLSSPRGLCAAQEIRGPDPAGRQGAHGSSAKQSSRCSSGPSRATAIPGASAGTRVPSARGTTVLSFRQRSSRLPRLLSPPVSRAVFLLPGARLSDERTPCPAHARPPEEAGAAGAEQERGRLAPEPPLLLRTLRWVCVVLRYVLRAWPSERRSRRRNRDRPVSPPSGHRSAGLCLSGGQAKCGPYGEQPTPSATSGGRGDGLGGAPQAPPPGSRPHPLTEAVAFAGNEPEASPSPWHRQPAHHTVCIFTWRTTYWISPAWLCREPPAHLTPPFQPSPGG